MAATPSIVVRKHAPYRGGTKEFSNRYHFAGGFPVDNAHFVTFADLVVADEQPICYPYVVIDEVSAYAAGSNVATYSKTYTAAGTLSGTGGDFTPLENCVLLRYATAARSSKNHPVYLFNYFHGAMIANAVTDGAVWATQKTAVEEYADDWLAGWSDGTNTYTRAGPNGAAATARFVNPYVHHRDFVHA